MSGWLAFWSVLAVLFAAAEVHARSLRLLPFALAAACAGTAGVAGASVGLQWGIYTVCAALLLPAAGRLARRLRR